MKNYSDVPYIELLTSLDYYVQRMCKVTNDEWVNGEKDENRINFIQIENELMRRYREEIKA